MGKKSGLDTALHLRCVMHVRCSYMGKMSVRACRKTFPIVMPTRSPKHVEYITVALCPRDLLTQIHAKQLRPTHRRKEFHSNAKAQTMCLNYIERTICASVLYLLCLVYCCMVSTYVQQSLQLRASRGSLQLSRTDAPTVWFAR